MPEQVGIFSRLKRLFSTDVIIRNVGGDQIKVADVDKIQAYGNVQTNSLVDKFTRLHRSSTQSTYSPALNYQTLRIQLYTDYEAMDTEPIIASALDIVSDECTLKNEAGEILQIRSSDENIQRILYNLFYDILNIEFNMWPWIRSMCKYGDFYLHLEIADKFGVFNVTPMSAYDLIRKEGENPKNPSEVWFEWDPVALSSTISTGHPNGKRRFENYEVAHFRLLADSNYLPYGRAYVEPARKVYKQYVLMKDAMMVHRIMRAPEKRVFYIDVGNIPPHEVDNYMQKIINKMKKTPYIDHQTGEYNLKYNMQNVLEDFYLPVRGTNSNTKIDTLKGLEYNAIDDVVFLRDEMLSALKVPKAFFGFEKDLQGKATLAAEDIRFARTIERLQRIIISELYKIALVHLYVQGYDGESLTNFELNLTSPSVVYEQEKVALWKEKVDLARNVIDLNLLPSDWIYDKIFQFSEDQLDEFRDQVVEDKKRLFRLNQIEHEGNDPAKSGTSFGTPHDLAALYGTGRMGNGTNVPEGYDETDPAGRPPEKPSLYGTQYSNFGKDPTGRTEYANTPNLEPNPIAPAYKGGSPLALEGIKTAYYKNKRTLESISKKVLIFERESKKSSLLDEGNIRDL